MQKGKLTDQIITVKGKNALINLGKKVIQRRESDASYLHLTNQFMEGFAEGVAELIAALNGEPAADMLEHITEPQNPLHAPLYPAPWCKGYDAGYAGLDVSSNPYSVQDEDFTAWDEGYQYSKIVIERNKVSILQNC